MQKKPRPRRAPPSPRAVWLLVGIFVIFAAILLTPGIFLLVQRQTGIPAQASVDECETTGSGRYESTHCSGSWIVGGSLLEGGHVVVGTIDGAEQSDQGKTIDVMVHGDTAYSRSLATPLVLIGFGLCPAIVALLLAVQLIFRRLGPS